MYQEKTAQKSNMNILDFSTFDSTWKTCGILSKSTFCPGHLKHKPSDILFVLQYGSEIGLTPMQSLTEVMVINGKPGVYGDTLLALCQSHSSCEWIRETFDEETMTATCEAKRKGIDVVVSTFSQKDAERAFLWGKVGPWVSYPKRMLQMRARGFALRDAFAFVLKGIKMKEELDDYVIIDNVSSKNEATQEEVDHLNFLIERLKDAKILDERKIKSWLDGLCEFSIETMSRNVLLKQIEHISTKYPFAEEEYNKPSLKIEHNNVIDVCFSNEETKEANING